MSFCNPEGKTHFHLIRAFFSAILFSNSFNALTSRYLDPTISMGYQCRNPQKKAQAFLGWSAEEWKPRSSKGRRSERGKGKGREKRRVSWKNPSIVTLVSGLSSKLGCWSGVHRVRGSDGFGMIAKAGFEHGCQGEEERERGCKEETHDEETTTWRWYTCYKSMLSLCRYSHRSDGCTEYPWRG